jgi:hypothetical protein
MTVIGAGAFVERLRFFDGQRLFAADLQDLEAFHREMRWLHNQSLHQPGVGSGFAVSGPKGAREVVIEPGYAIDALGREIVLTETHVEPVPPVAHDGFGAPAYYDLTVAYPEEDDLKATETREGLCAPRGAVRLREAPVFCWVRLGPPPDRLPVDGRLRNELLGARRVRLCRAAVLNCQLEGPISLAQRRNARPAARPHVACGRTEPHAKPATGGTPGIDFWEVSGPAETSGFGIGMRLRVATTAARFRTTPCYLAHVVGSRQFALPSPAIPGTNVELLLDGFVTVSDPQPDRFDLRLLVPDVLLRGRISATDAAKALNDGGLLDAHWRVEWMGIEG